MIMAVDPGRDKTGMAIYCPTQKTVLVHQVVMTVDFFQMYENWYSKYELTEVILGNGTYSNLFFSQLREITPDIQLTLIDEAYSTLEARDLYFSLNPPRGIRRLLPHSLQTPRQPFDDLVAVVLLKRHLGAMPKICK